MICSSRSTLHLRVKLKPYGSWQWLHPRWIDADIPARQESLLFDPLHYAI
jgi:hypothetical protein